MNLNNLMVDLFLISNDLNNIQELSELSRFYFVSGLFCERFEDATGVIRSRRSKKDRQCHGQKQKDTENQRLSNTNPPHTHTHTQ